MPDHTLDIIIPVYNEAENIRTAVERIDRAVTVPHRITFVSRGRSRAAEFALVACATAAALAIDLGVMYLLVDRLGILPMPAKILGTGSAFALNYAARQFFIFAAK